MCHSMYLAPIRGVTDTIFRHAFEECFGRFDFLLAPFITSVKGKEVAASHCKDILGPENDRSRLIPQILGNDPGDIVALANAFYTAGYATVNLNLGCPHPPVTRKKRGSGLLPYPESIAGIGTKIIQETGCSLSVKVRTGYTDPGDLQRLVPVLNDLPLVEVIIHPRTGKQGYSGTVDRDSFTSALSLLKHPVVYNGDIFSLDDYHEARKRFPVVSRWMIGRGVLRRPVLLQECRDEREMSGNHDLMRTFHDTVFNENRKRLFGPSHLLGKMKEFWYYFSCSFVNPTRVHRDIVHCTMVDQYRGVVERIFESFKPNFRN